MGEYTGVVPDAEGLCAKSYTDCNNPEVMFYTVFNCHNNTEVFEEREYRCFGQWMEDGLVYTYTQRKDIPGNECFVGKTIDDDRNIIAEAGQNCERGHQPEKYGMTLHRQAKCSHEMLTAASQPPVSVSESDFAPETIEQLLEEEEEEHLIKESRTISPRLVHHKVNTGRGHQTHNGRKHHNKHHRVSQNDEDIFSNEIPGSSSSRSSSAGRATTMGAAVVLATLFARTLLERTLKQCS